MDSETTIDNTNQENKKGFEARVSDKKYIYRNGLQATAVYMANCLFV